MARRDYALTAKGISSGMRRIAPDVWVNVEWREDYSFAWDGDGPDPVEKGLVPHDVWVHVEVELDDRKLEGDEYLGGVYDDPGEQDPNIHGYFPEMLYEALQSLQRELGGRPGSRKAWDPREDPSAVRAEVAAAIAFVGRSVREIVIRENRRRRA